MRTTWTLFLIFAAAAGCADNASSRDDEGSAADAGDSTSDTGAPDTDSGAGDTDSGTPDGGTPDADPDVPPDADPDGQGDAETDTWTIDCEPPPPACADDSDCATGEVCDSGDCLVPVEPELYQPATLLQIQAVDFPSFDALAGFDVDGNGTPDNLLGELVNALPGGPELVERVVNEAFDLGQIGLALEYDADPETCGTVVDSTAAAIALHLSTRDLNYDGLLDASEQSEVPVLRLLPSGFSDDRGPLCRLVDGSVANDGATLVGAGGVSCELALPLPDGTLVSLPVEALQFEADLVSLSTKDGEAAPNGRVGGYLEVQALVDEANRVAQSCACTGIDVGAPFATTTINGDSLTAQCVQDPGSADGCSDVACSNLPALCQGLTVLGLSADIASPDGGGVRDAVSFGFGVVLTPATTPPDPIAPTLVAVGDHYEANRMLQIGPGQTSLFVPVLANDQYDSDLDSLQTLGALEPDLGVLTWAIDGAGITFTVVVPLTDLESAEFTVPYTIGDGADRSSTATVTIRVSRRTLIPELQSDEFTEAPVDGRIILDVVANDVAGEGAVVVIGGVSTDYDYDTGIGTFGESATTLAGSTVTIDRTTNRIVVVPGGVGNETFQYRAYAWSPTGGESETVVADVYLFTDCLAGQYGETCLPCPRCSVGECLDGFFGSGECGCEFGYVADGARCVDVNECAGIVPVCARGWLCTNTVGSYECTPP